MKLGQQIIHFGLGIKLIINKSNSMVKGGKNHIDFNFFSIPVAETEIVNLNVHMLLLKCVIHVFHRIPSYFIN
jgi:hypothetical protein